MFTASITSRISSTLKSAFIGLDSGFSSLTIRTAESYMINQLKWHHSPSVLQIKRFPSFHLRWLCCVVCSPSSFGYTCEWCPNSQRTLNYWIRISKPVLWRTFPILLVLAKHLWSKRQKVMPNKKPVTWVLPCGTAVLDWMPISSSSMLEA